MKIKNPRAAGSVRANSMCEVARCKGTYTIKTLHDDWEGIVTCGKCSDRRLNYVKPN